MSSSEKRRAAAVKILRSSRKSVLPWVLRGMSVVSRVSFSASAVIRVRRGYVNWFGIGLPAGVLSRSFFVGSVVNGTSGMSLSDSICWPATPNFV